MRITVLSIGKTKESWLKEGLKLYLAKLERYTRLTWTELEDIKNAATLPVPELKRKESALILGKIIAGDHIILLDEQGKSLTSPGLAAELESLMNRSVQNIVFVIGGAYGFDEALYQQARQKIALSSLTFTHQMVRVILAEQLYRAFTILNNEKYHHL
jgi:23S rRNA (pseudouridine1915-N3)-methyltransferase